MPMFLDLLSFSGFNLRSALMGGCCALFGLLSLVGLAGCSVMTGGDAKRATSNTDKPKLSASRQDLAATKQAIADGSFQVTGLTGMMFVRESGFRHTERAIGRFELGKDQHHWQFTLEKLPGIMAMRLTKSGQNLYTLHFLGRAAEHYSSVSELYVAYPWMRIVDDEAIDLLREIYDAKRLKQEAGCRAIRLKNSLPPGIAKVFYDRYGKLEAAIPRHIYMRFVDFEIDFAVMSVKSQHGIITLRHGTARLIRPPACFKVAGICTVDDRVR